jgi:spermidine synthase
VPSHLTTIEAVRHYHRILNDDGVLIFNLGSAITGPGSRFLNAEIATYKQVFPGVHLFKVNPTYPDDKLQNLIIVASKSERQPAPALNDTFIASLLERRYKGDIPLTGSVLTDDLAPVEHFNSIAQNIYLTEQR